MWSISVDVEPLQQQTLHQTVALFYVERAREEPVNGKRRLKIYLASGEDVTGKAGQPKGSTRPPAPLQPSCRLELSTL